MKTVYFVRHGESVNNAAHRYNTPDSPLSEKGKKQAEEIAERCVRLPIEAIVSSSMMRAQQTATVVGQKLGMQFISSDLFIEREMPSSLQGQPIYDPEVVRINTTLDENFHVPGFRYEDDESFDDMKTRALAALAYLEARDEKHILVVSHGFFLWVIAAVALFGKSLTGEECMGIVRGLDLMENTGLTIMRTNDLSKKTVKNLVSPWQLWVWNDHAHLG